MVVQSWKFIIWFKTYAYKSHKHLSRLVVLGWNESVQDENDGEAEKEV